MYGSTEPTAADVYGFCCLAYEMFMGRPLFGADTLPALIACHFEHDGNPVGLAALHATPALAPLAQILAAGLVPKPRAGARPSASCATPSASCSRTCGAPPGLSRSRPDVAAGRAAT